MKSPQAVVSDFDGIAALLAALPDHLGPHERPILRHVPRAAAALDIGCGTGELARHLALRCDSVTGIDVSPQMIEVARTRAEGMPNLQFHVADAVTWLSSGRTYGCVTAMASLHHMDLRRMIGLIRGALEPGGVLLIVDLVDRHAIRYLPVNTLANAVSGFRNRVLHRRAHPHELREAWLRHGEGETYLTPGEARRLYRELLPSAEVRQHLLWRYSVVWRK